MSKTWTEETMDWCNYCGYIRDGEHNDSCPTVAIDELKKVQDLHD